MSKKPDVWQWELQRDKWEQLERQGLLDTSLLSHLWPDALQHTAVLLGLMEKLDLLCPVSSPPLQVLSTFVSFDGPFVYCFLGCITCVLEN